jgi:zinc protease
VGDFDRDQMLEKLAVLLASLPPSEGPARSVPRVVRRETGSKNTLRKDVSQAVVVLGYPGPALQAPERYALDVWNGILSGMGSRLFTRLRDECHLCYFTGAFVSPLLAGGAIGAYVGTDDEHVEAATEALLEELSRSSRELPGDEELARSKNNLAGSHLIDMQTRMSWAAAYARDEALGLGYEESLRYLDGIQRVGAREVREAAARHLDPSRLVVSVLRPSAEEPAAERGVGA